MEIATTVSCFKAEYLPYLEDITPPWGPIHTDLEYGELKYRYNLLLGLAGQSNEDKAAIRFILNEPLELSK